MSLTPYCQRVLARELALSEYDGLTADQAWAWLMVPTVTVVRRPTHARLTPGLVASLLGPAKAEALASRVKVALPSIGDALMSSGVDLSDPACGPFLDGLIGAPISQADIDLLKALGWEAHSVTSPRRFDRRFDPERWHHVAPDGSPGADDDPAISGFPNDLDRASFDAAWAQAGRA